MGGNMNKLIYVFLIGSALLNTAPAFAVDRADPANRAVHISLGSAGGPLVKAALRSNRNPADACTPGQGGADCAGICTSR